MNRLGLAVILCASAAHAQFTNTYNYSHWNNPVSASMDVMISQQIQRQMLERSVLNKYGKAPPPAAKPAPAAPKLPLTATDFKAAPKGKFAAEFAGGLDALNAEQKKQFEAVFNQALAQIEADKTFRKDNVAYALAYLLGASIQIALEKEVPDADAVALAQSFNDSLGGDETFKKMPASERQRLYEGSLVTAGFLAAIYTAGQTDPAMKQQAKTIARSTLQKFGVKL